MKKLLAIAALTAVTAFAPVAQSSREEQEVRGFLAEYDNAVSSRDIAFLERVLPNDYVYTGTSGRMSDRARVLKFFRERRDRPAYRMNSLKHENVKVRVVGNMAVVTNDYTAQTTPVDSPGVEPHTDRGRHIVVFEKRDGRWMVIAEQDTEQPHDDELMEQQVLTAGRKYNELMKRMKSGRSYAELEQGGDTAALNRLLADEYTYTSRDGEIHNKAQDLEGYKANQIEIDSAELSEQKVRVVDNSTAIETGKIKYVGTNGGAPYDIAKRYTRTWVFHGERWQIIADHTSAVKQKD